jgi:hypothetical protein
MANGKIITYNGSGFTHVNSLIYDIGLAFTADTTKTPTTGDPTLLGIAASGDCYLYSIPTTDMASWAGGAYADDPDKDTPQTWVFEATQAIDPFAQLTVIGEMITTTQQPDGSFVDTTGDAFAAPYTPNPAKDPWRICFQTFAWKNYPSFTKAVAKKDDPESPQTPASWKADTTEKVLGLAVYIGTPATLATDSANALTIGYRMIWPNPIPVWAVKAVADGNIWQSYVDAVGTKNGGKMPASFLNKKIYSFVEPQGNTGARWSHNFETSTTTAIDKWGPNPVVNPDDTPLIKSNFAKLGGGGLEFGYTEGDGPDVTDNGQLFINRYTLSAKKDSLFGSEKATASTGAPLSYHLTFSDHGMFLAVWAQNPEEEAQNYSWLLVQRPVNKKTGIVRGVTSAYPNGDPGNAGNRPLFCVNSTNNNFYKFVVREHDLPIPAIPKDAANNSEDSGAVLNAYPQQSLTENGEYVITFVNNLNSSRFKYADELDMLGTVSADIVGGGTDIDVNVYNEIDGSGQPSKRTYHALWPSGAFGTKMRVVVVKSIPDPNPIA